MSVFKVGDTVKVVDVPGGYGYKNGEILVVTEVGYSYGYQFISCAGNQTRMVSRRFELVPPQLANGVDAEGKEIYFGVDDVKVGMKVVTKAGQIALVFDGNIYGKTVHYLGLGGFDEVAIESTDYGSHIIEAYLPSIGGHLLKNKITGDDKLVWKAVDFAEKKKAKGKLEDDLAQAWVKVAAARCEVEEAQIALDTFK